jgi:two-component system, cell cycle sensor histidine kinase and response regulator CckA
MASATPGRSSPAAESGGADDQRVARLLLWVVAIVGTLTALIAVGTLLVLPFAWRHIETNLVVIAQSVVALIMLRRGRVRQAAHLFIFVLWSVITFSCFRLGGSSSPVIASYSAVIATTSVLMSRRAGLVYAAMSAAAIIAIFLAELVGGWVPPVHALTPVLEVLILAGSALMTGGVIYLSAGVREEADRRAEESAVWFAELVRTAPEGILTLDAQQRVASANPAAEAILGLPAASVAGQPLASLPSLASASELSEGVRRPQIILRADGTTREVEVEKRLLSVGGQAGAWISLRDVTEARATERDRARLTEHLHQSQKQESIGLLAGGIAHDFNNLITVALINLATTRRHEVAPAARDRISDAEKAIVRSGELTRQLLAFSRRQVLVPRNLSVNEAVEGMSSMLRRLFAENIELKISLGARGIIRADPSQLEQVVLNLAVNARDAMPEGGVLTISTADLPGGVSPNGEPVRGQVCLAVEDTGTGIPPEVVARIFEPFFTTKPVGRGTGLGLAVVEGIVRQSGGQVRVHSVVGKGTRFEILFPVAVATAPDRPVEPGAPRAERGDGRVVLLAEDEPSLREVMVRELERVGFKVQVSNDGEDALRVAEAAAGIDVAVLDVVMPKLGGPDAARKLRAARPGLKTLFLSGYSDRSLEELGVLGPHSAFLAKPFRPEELLSAVFALLARER